MIRWLVMLVLCTLACGGGYVVAHNSGEPSRAKHGVLAEELRTCNAALQSMAQRADRLEEQLLQETAILDDCRATCGTMLRKSPP